MFRLIEIQLDQLDYLQCIKLGKYLNNSEINKQ